MNAVQLWLGAKNESNNIDAIPYCEKEQNKNEILIGGFPEQLTFIVQNKRVAIPYLCTYILCIHLQHALIYVNLFTQTSQQVPNIHSKSGLFNILSSVFIQISSKDMMR